MSAMKTLIIVLQLVLLAIAGWFTRPAEADFRQYVHHHLAAKADGLLSGASADAHANKFLGQCTFRDRGLWVEVVKDGKVVYVGVLAHWFDRALIERNDMSRGISGQLSVGGPSVQLIRQAQSGPLRGE